MRYLDCLIGVLAEAEACPEDTAARAMRYAVIEWCKETFCYVTPLEIETDGTEPAPPALDAMWIVKIIDARIDGEAVDVLAANDPDLEDRDADDPAIVFADPSQAYLVPAPSTPVTVELLCALTPGQESTEFPDLLWQRYAEHLEHGALKRLHAMKGKPWSDPGAASFHNDEFEAAKKRVAAAVGINRVTNAQRLRVKPV